MPIVPASCLVRLWLWMISKNTPCPYRGGGLYRRISILQESGPASILSRSVAGLSCNKPAFAEPAGWHAWRVACPSRRVGMLSAAANGPMLPCCSPGAMLPRCSRKHAWGRQPARLRHRPEPRAPPPGPNGRDARACHGVGEVLVPPPSAAWGCEHQHPQTPLRFIWGWHRSCGTSRRGIARDGINARNGGY
jgi:hypothetical protein